MKSISIFSLFGVYLTVLIFSSFFSSINFEAFVAGLSRCLSHRYTTLEMPNNTVCKFGFRLPEATSSRKSTISMFYHFCCNTENRTSWLIETHQIGLSSSCIHCRDVEWYKSYSLSTRRQIYSRLRSFQHDTLQNNSESKKSISDHGFWV